jgi:molybdopterin/thiamine biosynthesis adenylyltransferase
VGVGGLGCPAALALQRAGVGLIGLCDDDVVERSNLHRQIVFGEADVGAPKVAVAAAALRRQGLGLTVREHACRLLPENALGLVSEYDIVLEGSDNFATKFLASDACRLAGVPIVHASAIRWIGTAFAVGAAGAPCYRCLFEDMPHESAPNCDEAGVMGPVAGVVAAAQVDLALAWLDGVPVGGNLVSYDGREDRLRCHRVEPRADCALCSGVRRIHGLDASAYVSTDCSS